ncbi:cytochrome c peroxidase [Marinomonas sp. MED121]|uniref:cytochrome-c peroxidase n=1 Tax=Marinomonas sp. MED121 TaxID=314277 RepID=UPI000303C7A0|nr:cytochrome c peroxidase [Marinomonas sp. MED121]
MRNLTGLMCFTGIVLAGCQVVDEPTKVVVKKASSLPVATDDPKAILGSQLYFDVNLSLNRNQSCATCHNPAKGFIDDRDNGVSGMASLGSDQVSIGDRNTPTAAYAALSPLFSKKQDGSYIGGQFHDGRASSLADQAAGPPLNPGEMAMLSKDQVLQRINENAFYKTQFAALFGEEVLVNSETAYQGMSDAIMAFEQTELFMPFDSKYDRYLRGEVAFNDQEELGRTLFFSEQFTNCNQCHQLNSSPFYATETFTDFTYHNIGVPENLALRKINGVTEKDLGLFANPDVNGQSEQGKFKVPSLRNVAVTGPYMHNGVFQDLRTVVLFYDKYNNVTRKVNPESGTNWLDPEVTQNLAPELTDGPALDDQRIDAIVAFLKTLTDERYEALIN